MIRHAAIATRVKHGMKPARVLSIVCAALAVAGARAVCAETVIPGSTGFCLHEIPLDETGKRRWINLGIVQYVEATRTEVTISYGGGRLGSGHEAKIAVTGMEDALAMLEKMRGAAAACR